MLTERTWTLWAGAALCLVLTTARVRAAELDIELQHNSAAEQATADELRRLAEKFDLTPWLFTRRILIDEEAIPHSHPVLTLHTRHRRDENLLLSTFVHEELHWWLVARQEQTAAAVDELRQIFTNLPVGSPDGADTELSSYEHLIVIHLEYQADRRLLGEKQAAEAMAFWSTDHYRELYRIVLNMGSAVGRIVNRHKLDCCPSTR